MLTRRIRLPHPVDLPRTLAPLAHGRGDPSVRFDGGVAWRAVRTPDGPGTERLVVAGEALEIQAWGAGAGWLLETAGRLCGLEDDDASFSPSGVLGDLHRRLRGVRLGATGRVMEVLVPTILEQKVVGAGARRSYRKLVAAHGEPAPGPLSDLMIPPEPERLAAIPYWELHPFGVERRRAETLRTVAAHAHRLEEALTAGPAVLGDRLTALRGIGAWTAAIVRRLAGGDPDAVETGDYHLPSRVSWVLARERRANDARMLELLEPYRGQRGRVVTLIEASGIGAPRRGPRVAVGEIASR